MRKERVTFSAEDSTLIWSKFRNLIASTDHVKGKSVKVLGTKDPEVSASIRAIWFNVSRC